MHKCINSWSGPATPPSNQWFLWWTDKNLGKVFKWQQSNQTVSCILVKLAPNSFRLNTLVKRTLWGTGSTQDNLSLSNLGLLILNKRNLPAENGRNFDKVVGSYRLWTILGCGHDSILQCSHKFGPQSLGTGTSEDRTTSQRLAVRKTWNSSLTTGHTGNTLPVPMFSLCVLWSVDIIANFAPPESSEVDTSRNSHCAQESCQHSQCHYVTMPSDHCSFRVHMTTMKTEETTRPVKSWNWWGFSTRWTSTYRTGQATGTKRLVRVNPTFSVSRQNLRVIIDVNSCQIQWLNQLHDWLSCRPHKK